MTAHPTHPTRSGRIDALLIALLACAPLVPAQASDALEASPPASPATSEIPSETLRKVGEARLRVMFWSIYDSRLFTSDGSYREGARPLRLEIEYLRAIDAETLVKRTGHEWEAMGRQHPRQDAWLARLEDLWPDISARDVLTIRVNEDNVSTFVHNGRELGTIVDPAFGQEFLDIWLSEDSTRPELRQALLGGDELD